MTSFPGLPGVAEAPRTTTLSGSKKARTPSPMGSSSHPRWLAALSGENREARAFSPARASLRRDQTKPSSCLAFFPAAGSASLCQASGQIEFLGHPLSCLGVTLCHKRRARRDSELLPVLTWLHG